MGKEEVGHNFLARLGKTRLRPGGRKATDWLIASGDFNKDKKVLEVACNMCTTAMHWKKPKPILRRITYRTKFMCNAPMP